MRFLDCFAGLGGASEGFAREGFDCTGIEIEPKIAKMYPYKVIVADMRELRGEDFRGYDVVWGSPPCRDFSIVGNVFGHTWKRKPDPLGKGMELVKAYQEFVRQAEPSIWIMENVPTLQKYIGKARIETNLGINHMRRCFWGTFPELLIPKTSFKVVYAGHWEKGKRNSKVEGRIFGIQGRARAWERAKIPLACSHAFAKACREKLEAMIE